MECTLNCTNNEEMIIKLRKQNDVMRKVLGNVSKARWDFAEKALRRVAEIEKGRKK